MSKPETQPETDILNGWKEIAAYLGRSVRSAQRWEADLGLPIERINTPDGGQIVHASRREIDAWRRELAARHSTADPLDRPGQGATPVTSTVSDPADMALGDAEPIAPPGSGPVLASQPGRNHAAISRVRLVTALAGVLALGVALGAWFGFRAAPILGHPAEFVVEGRMIRALTAAGREVWFHELPRAGSHPSTMTPTIPVQGDLDGDGVLEVAIPVSYTAPHQTPATSDTVFFFDRTGALRWTVQPSIVIRDASNRFEGPWQVYAIEFSKQKPGYVWLGFAHNTWRPAFVLELASDGRQSVRLLWGAGLRTMAEWSTPSGRFLAVGGHDAITMRATTALVDLDGRGARWPRDERVLTCDGCPTDPPAAFYEFPRSEVASAYLRMATFVFRVRVVNGRLRMETDEGVRPAGLAWLNQDFTVSDAAYLARYWVAHRQLEADGRLEHPADRCPELTTPMPIRIWRGETGWTTTRVPIATTPSGTPNPPPSSTAPR